MVGWMDGRMGERTADGTRQAMDCNVTSRSVRVTTVAIEKLSITLIQFAPTYALVYMNIILHRQLHL